MLALRGFAILLLCQSAGEVLARLLGGPFPGPVIGLLLLLLALILAPLRGRWPRLRMCCWRIFRCCSCRSAWA